MDNRHVPKPSEPHYSVWFLVEAALRMNARRLPLGEESHVRKLVGEELWEQLGGEGGNGNLFGKHVAKNLEYFSLEYARKQGTRTMYRRREEAEI